MPTLEDLRLGQLAVAHGLAQPTEIEECLAEQHRGEQAGRYLQLGEILIDRGFVTRRQLERLTALQQETVQKVTKIGAYELIRKIGEGGMGAVYQARDTRNGNIVALKVLPRSRAKDETFLERFKSEAHAAFELDHVNIVRGLDFSNADGYYFLVMEFVEGHDIYSLLQQNGRFSEPEAVHIMRQIASALDHIHGEQLVHRDIKPENILVTKDNVAKLTDMGLAVDKENQGRRRITKAGIAMGTPFYLSPEQIQGKSEIDIRSDIYSFGATVYEMVTGKPPFDGETAAVVMMKHLNEQVPSPYDIDKSVSSGFCHVLEKMMAKDPADRYQSPADMLKDLDLISAGKPPVSTRPAPGRSSVSRPNRKQEARTSSKYVSPHHREGWREVNENLRNLDQMLEPQASEPGHGSRLMAGSQRSTASHVRRAVTSHQASTINLKWAVLAGVAVMALTTIVVMVIKIFGGS